MLALVLFTKDKQLLIPSILLVYTSILMHYAKESYIKSYLSKIKGVGNPDTFYFN